MTVGVDQIERDKASEILVRHNLHEHGLEHEHVLNKRLFNADIAPRAGKGGWGAGSLFNWWMSAWHSLGGYAMAVGFMALGLNGWQALVGMVLGMIVMWLASNLMGTAGQRVGVSFPVFARIAFGVYGANVPAFFRAIVAVCWYGINTFLASRAVLILILKIEPAAAAWDANSILGLSTLGWICLLVLWSLQLLVLQRGMEAVRRLSDYAGPTIWIAMLFLAIWTLQRADWNLDWSLTTAEVPLTGGAVILAIASTAFLTVAFMAGPMLNFSDFTRLSSSPRSVKNGNALGLLINGIGFALVSVIIGIASAEVYGEVVTDPIVMLGALDSVSLLLVATIAVAIAQVGVNVICNFVSAAFDFVHLAPGMISFKVGGIITAVLSLVIMPWKMYSSPFLINYFLGSVGALMGPLFGIIMADYYLVKKQKVLVKDLYTSNERGEYHYKSGVNRQYVGIFIVVGVICAVLAMIPQFAVMAPFAWPIGVLLSAVAVVMLNRAKSTA